LFPKAADWGYELVLIISVQPFTIISICGGADLARPSVRPRPRNRKKYNGVEDEDDDWSTFDFAT